MKPIDSWKNAIAATLVTGFAFTAPALAASAATSLATPTTSSKPAIVVLGDSLSAEYGLPRDTGWVPLMRKRVADQRIDYSVANASISGDTTSGGRARLPAVLARLKPAVLIVELGANDALRGVPLASTEQNLRAIIADAQRAHARVVLIGMYVPPNYGPDYTKRFHALYETLAATLHVPLVPFLLAGIETQPELFQADQIHPTQQAQPRLLDNVWPTVQPLLGRSPR
ncbi:MAG: Esterase TesA [Burkholderia plantarii]|nr:MAG: Esterase TesA [Burkholderia plantarii]